uniref:Uncharacterized protein n=1 Tax=Cucumis melo TaxID=3656 RepID=A0A9I9EA11_CUCME
MGHWDVQLMHHLHLHQEGEKQNPRSKASPPFLFPLVTVADRCHRTVKPIEAHPSRHSSRLQAVRPAPPAARIQKSCVVPRHARAAKPLLNHLAFFRSFAYILGRLDQLELERGISRHKGNYCNLDLGASLLGKHIFFLLLGLVEQISRITTYLGPRSPTGRQSSMDIDMIRVIRWDPRSLIVLVFPSDSLQTSFQVEAGVKARASWRATRIMISTQYKELSCYIEEERRRRLEV